jgi:hypothetical protein
MNNGATKGGSAEAWTTVKNSPGLEGLWQLHVATAGGKDHNVAETFVANVDETTGYPLTVTAHRDGSFAVTNPRNQTTKSYK